MEDICRNIQEQILELITGTLSAEKAAELQRHISSCPACRKYLQVMQADDKLLGGFAEAMQPTVARLEGNVIDALGCRPLDKTVHTIPIWRKIIKSRITKFAAAAVIIIAVLIGISHFKSSIDGASVAWAKVIEQVKNIPALTFKMTAEITFPGNKKLLTKSDVYVAGDYGTRENIYMNGELFIIKYRLPNKKVTYQIRPKEKSYVRFDLSGEEAAIGRDPDDPRQWLEKILSEDYVEIGHSNINGIDVEGIESQETQVTGSKSMTMRLWVDVETNLPVRIELEGEDWEAGQMRPQQFTMYNFQWDVELDASLFEPDIPDDYMQIHPQTQIRPQKEPEVKEPPKKLSDDEKREQVVVKEVARALFQACANKDWNEFSKLWPGLSLNKMQKLLLGGLEIISIGNPFKLADSSTWYVPYEIKLKFGEIKKRNLRIRYDEATQKYIPRGGL